MGKKFGLAAIRLMVSVNLLYAAIFAKFAGVPQSVALFTQMSQAVHGLISQPVFRLGSGVFETTVAVLFLSPKPATLGAMLVNLSMAAISPSTPPQTRSPHEYVSLWICRKNQPKGSNHGNSNDACPSPFPAV